MTLHFLAHFALVATSLSYAASAVPRRRASCSRPCLSSTSIAVEMNMISIIVLLSSALLAFAFSRTTADTEARAAGAVVDAGTSEFYKQMMRRCRRMVQAGMRHGRLGREEEASSAGAERLTSAEFLTGSSHRCMLTAAADITQEILHSHSSTAPVTTLDSCFEDAIRCETSYFTSATP